MTQKGIDGKCADSFRSSPPDKSIQTLLQTVDSLVCLSVFPFLCAMAYARRASTRLWSSHKRSLTSHAGRMPSCIIETNILSRRTNKALPALTTARVHTRQMQHLMMMHRTAQRLLTGLAGRLARAGLERQSSWAVSSLGAFLALVKRTMVSPCTSAL